MDRLLGAALDAAAQHFHGTMRGFPAADARLAPHVMRPVDVSVLAAGCHVPPSDALACMPTPQPPREFFIQGVTKAGKTFRPSDWAERLAGALSSFRPKGSGIGAHIGYSPYCVPRVIDGLKCVIVNEALRDLEPMAWDFVMHFARDNDLQVVEACLIPDPPQAPAAT